MLRIILHLQQAASLTRKISHEPGSRQHQWDTTTVVNNECINELITGLQHKNSALGKSSIHSISYEIRNLFAKTQQSRDGYQERLEEGKQLPSACRWPFITLSIDSLSTYLYCGLNKFVMHLLFVCQIIYSRKYICFL